MRVTLAFVFLAAPALVSATLNPAHSNTKGKCPSINNCKPEKVSYAIQAAECSHNTRTHVKQTYAVFKTDHQFDSSHGSPYGTCSAYTCKEPTSFVKNNDCWTFFWSDKGEKKSVGTGCIRDPNDGVCGCESSDGVFHRGRNDCK